MNKYLATVGNMGDEIWFSLFLRGRPSQAWEDELYLCRGIHITMTVALPGILPTCWVYQYIRKTNYTNKSLRSQALEAAAVQAPPE